MSSHLGFFCIFSAAPCTDFSGLLDRFEAIAEGLQRECLWLLVREPHVSPLSKNDVKDQDVLQKPKNK